MELSFADMAWTLLRLVVLVAVPASIAWLLARRPRWRQPFKLAMLVLVPCLITLWFMHDGGLANGLNRLAYYVVTGLFFAGYAMLMAIIHLVQRARRRPSEGNLRTAYWSAAALLAWTCATALFENAG